MITKLGHGFRHVLGLSAALGAALLVTTLGTGAARAQSDAFSGATLDRGRWDVALPMGASTVTQNGQLFLTNKGAPGAFCSAPGALATGTGVAMRRRLAGDFDVAVDFHSFKGAEIDASGTTTAALAVYQDVSHQLVVRRVRGQFRDTVQTAAYTGGGLYESPANPHAALSGRLRLVRSNGVITSYVDGVVDATVAGITGNVVVSLLVGGPGDVTSGVIFDNFTINAGSLQSQTPACADGFDGNLIDAEKWDVSSPLGAGGVGQSNAVYATSDGSAGRFCGAPGLFGPGAGLGLRRTLTGDFDVAVDFSDFTGVPLSSPNRTQAFLNVYQDSANQMHIKRMRGVNQDAVQTVGRVANRVVNGPVTGNTQTAGRMRIVRTGSTLVTYFDDVPDFEVAGIGGEVLVSFMIFGPVGSLSSAVFDNFALNGVFGQVVSGCGNHAPVAFHGGPYLVDEGGVVALLGSAADPEGAPMRYEWDMDGNGSFELPGASASFVAGTQDGPAEFPVTFRACDPEEVCTTAATSVKLVNLPPTAAFVAPSPITAGSSSQVRLSNPTDFSAADVTAGFRYGLACDGKDSSLPGSYLAGSVSATRECSFASAGDYLVKGRIFDKDGGQRTYEAVVHVTAPPNQAPSAEAGGPYDVNEGGSVGLHGSGSDPDDDPLVYRWDLDGNGSFETTAANPTFNAFFLDGPSTRTVSMQACDTHDVCSSDTALVRIANVAPSAVLVVPGLLFEGSSADVALTAATDPGIADTQAGLRYGFACDGLDASLPSSYASAGASASAKCAFPQSGAFAVKGRIFDKDGGQRTYVATVVVANQAPVATFVASSPITEGGASQLALIGASDPSPADVAAGLRYGFACNGLDGALPQSYAAASTSSTIACGFPQDGTYTVKGRIFDKDGGQTTYTATVLVRNQAPVATFVNDGPVSEGGGSRISLVNPSDPGPIDTAVGFRYGFACDGNETSLPQSYAAASAASSTLCAFPESGSFTVKGRIFDQDGGFSSYEQTIVVDNQPPTAAFTAESPVGEGSNGQLVLGNAFDASAADAATLRFGFACDGLEASLPQSWAAAGAANATACPFPQDGSYVVKARIFDADGGFSTYEATVVVFNRAPTAVFTASQPSSEGGSSVLALGDAQDPGPVDVAVGLRYGFACDGQDASLPQSYATAGSVATVTCAFGQSGTYTVKGRVFDQDGGMTTYEQTLFIANDPPAAVFTATSPIDEGSSSLLSLADGSDASAADAAALRYGFACDGREATLPADYERASTVNVAACLFPQDGIYVVKGRVLDPDGGMTTYSATVLVMNVAPTALLTATGPISEGGASVVALEQPFDPGTLDVAAGLRFGFACDGRDAALPETYAAASLSDRTTCAFPQSGSYTVKGRIIDQDGGMNTYAITVVVENVAPVATFQASSLIPEGSSATLSFANATATDPSPADRAAGLRYAFACDGQTSSLAQSWAAAGDVATVSCPYADNGSYQVRGRVFDQDGGFTDYLATVGVQNVAPVITSFTVPTAAQKLTASVPVSAAFTDVGRLDTHTVLWQWGDGTSSVGTVSESAGAGTTTASHKYAAPGIYKVTVIVTDKDGGVASASSQWVTVYDGYSDVKGYGTIDLPSTQTCAYTCHSSCQKRVGEFTFDAKYRSGQTTPTGSVRFDVDADNLVFRGVTQQWLVVAGATLKLRGTGSVNGKGTYQFLITATDGKLLSRRTTDGFRIKIWNAATGAVTFDNRPGFGDEATDTQTISSGDVTIYR